MMNTLIVFLIIIVCLLAFFSGRRNQELKSTKGLFPKTKPTMFDVRDSIIKGEKEKAVRTYCQIFNVSKYAAQKAVDELERSIQEKNFEV